MQIYLTSTITVQASAPPESSLQLQIVHFAVKFLSPSLFPPLPPPPENWQAFYWQMLSVAPEDLACQPVSTQLRFLLLRNGLEGSALPHNYRANLLGPGVWIPLSIPTICLLPLKTPPWHSYLFISFFLYPCFIWFLVFSPFLCYIFVYFRSEGSDWVVPARIPMQYKALAVCCIVRRGKKKFLKLPASSLGFFTLFFFFFLLSPFFFFFFLVCAHCLSYKPCRLCHLEHFVRSLHFAVFPSSISAWLCVSVPPCLSPPAVRLGPPPQHTRTRTGAGLACMNLKICNTEMHVLPWDALGSECSKSLQAA